MYSNTERKPRRNTYSGFRTLEQDDSEASLHNDKDLYTRADLDSKVLKDKFRAITLPPLQQTNSSSFKTVTPALRGRSPQLQTSIDPNTYANGSPFLKNGSPKIQTIDLHEALAHQQLYQLSKKTLPQTFVPCKQKQTALYPEMPEGPEHLNMAKHSKKESKSWRGHQLEDVSSKITPFGSNGVKLQTNSGAQTKLKLKNLLNNLEGQIDMAKVDIRVKATNNDKKKKGNKDILEPITYKDQNGVIHKLNTYMDLLPHVKLESFETVVLEKLRALKETDQSQIPENDRDPMVKMDETFLGLVDKSRPYGQYFQQSVGDRLLMIERIDRMKYDIVDEHTRKKQLALMSDLKGMR